MARAAAPAILTRGALNRALLARQLLLQRTRMPPARAVERLAGLQAQNPSDPYLALWSRLAGFDPAALSRLVAQRKAVRLALMRSTIHLVTARDARTMRPALQEVQERLFLRTPYARALRGADLRAIVAAGRALLEQSPRTTRELGLALREQWPDYDAASLGFALRIHAPLVQVPPRGLWQGRGPTRHTTLEHWLGQPLAPPMPPETLVRRYLQAFGPASVRDAQLWSGLGGLEAVFERLRPRLRTFEDERGRELFDLPRAPRPPADTPAPPRFLPEFDNVFIGHADRARILADGVKAPAAYGSHRWSVFLLDGFVQGCWRLDQTGGGAVTVRIAPQRPIAPAARKALAAEAAQAAAFLHPASPRRTVRFERGP